MDKNILDQIILDDLQFFTNIFALITEPSGHFSKL